MIWKIICCVVGGYLFGCFSTAYIVGKWNKIDIRTYGSGNAGTTNALRTLGKKAGIITFIGDLLKALAAILLVRFLIFPDTEYVSLLELYTGLGVVLGHNYPFWLKFKGGRGVAVTTGVFFALQPIPSIFGLFSFIITVAISRYVSLASMLAVTFSSFLLMYCYDFQLHYCIILSLYTVIAIWRHRKNIVRLYHRSENKLFEQKIPLVEEERKNSRWRKSKMKISVMGAGTWGTALAILLANNGHEVMLWSALKNETENLRNQRDKIHNLPGAVLPDSVYITDDYLETVKCPDIIVFAVASPFVRETAHKMSSIVNKNQIIVNVGKGIEERTLDTLTDIIKEEIPQADVAVLSGPSHAEEVSRGIPTTCVVGAVTRATANCIQDAFMSDTFRVYTSPDVIGIELGGSLKNVIALAAGIADGLGFGDNTKAALMTRGIAEISRLGVKMGGRMETFSGLSGVGDLIVTCSSTHSRNRNAGFYIGQGMSMKEAMDKVAQVVEGVNSAKAALALAKKYKVEMPIVEQVNLILFSNKSPRAAVTDLLLRDKTQENGSLDWLEK